MKSSLPSLCAQPIGHLLDHDLDGAQSAALEVHMESCPRCQSELTRQAADQDQWDQAKQFLRDDDDDLDLLGDEFGKLGSKPTPSIGVSSLLEALAPTDDPRWLGRLGPFEIAGVIGCGGMGIVLKAFDPSLSRFVAIKVLAPELWFNAAARARFAREARAAASVVHDHVIEIFSVDAEGPIPYFTMPYLRGETLAARIAQRGPLELKEILRIARQLAAGLDAAHRQGLVHRDIKPANVFLTHGAERVQLTDFGLAQTERDERLTLSGVLTGTPAFMSPEQVAGQPLDQRSDLFSLGSLLYTMAAGQPPFAGESMIQTLRKIMDEAPAPLESINPAAPTWLVAIISKLLSKSPDDRYSSAASLAKDLDACLAHCQAPDTCSQPRSVLRLQAQYEKARRKSTRQVLSPRTKAWMVGVTLLIVGLSAWRIQEFFALLMAGPQPNSISVVGKVVDPEGKPLAKAVVLAIRKTWPNNRYQQESLKTSTGANGKFVFDSFAPAGRQYAVLLTTLPEGHSMASDYRLVENGQPLEEITLTSKRSTPTKIRIVSEGGRPVAGATVLPSSRVTAEGKEYLTYSMQVGDGRPTDAEGLVTLDAFEPGDTAKIYLDVQGEISEHAIEIRAGTTAEVKVRVLPETPVTLQGQVTAGPNQPLAEVPVLVILKTWPSGRFRMETLQTKTDREGRFKFENALKGQRKHEFLVTVIADGYAMASEYREMEQERQDDPVLFTLEPSQPVTLVVTDRAGNPVENVVLSPTQRKTSRPTPHLNYPAHRQSVSFKTDAKGQALLSAWKVGEQGEVIYERSGTLGKLTFEVPESRRVELRLPEK